MVPASILPAMSSCRARSLLKCSSAISHARNGSFSSKCGSSGLLAPVDEETLGEDMLCAYDDLRDAECRGAPFASLGSDVFEGLRPKASEGAGGGAPFRLTLLELRRRVCGKGEDGTRAFGSRGEAGPGDRSFELLVLRAWSERRLTGPGRDWGVASSLLCCAPLLRGVVSLPAPPSECDGW